MGPYRAAHELYWRAGWRGVLPLPPRAKHPPPRGWTGRGAPYPSWPDVHAWADSTERDGNIALRLPDGVIGLDVDDYWDRAGGASLDELVRKLGELPPTWTSTARDDRSGIRLYRVPTGLRWPGQAAPGIEIIQEAHRYAVVWPSMHPEVGKIYRWGGPPMFTGEVPDVRALPHMPPAWVEYVTGLVMSGPALEPAELDDSEAGEWLSDCRSGEACPPVLDVFSRATETLSSREVRGSRHELTRDASRAIAGYGGEGHAGARGALAMLRDAFLAALEGERGRNPESEWLRMLGGAVRLAAARNPAPRQACDCALMAGEGVQFDVGELNNSQSSIESYDNGSVTNDGEGGAAAQVATTPLDLTDVLASRLLTAAQLRDQPAPAALIDGLLTLDSASWLIARSGSYKSFVALDWAGHVAAGRVWMGREVACGPVVYVVAEGVGGMGPRIRAWEARNGEMCAGRDGVHFVPFPVQAAREDHWAALVAVCERLSPALVILDTQARITVGLDENDNSQMGRFVEAVERLRRACGACVLVVHHIGRNGQDARGASAIDGAQDAELRLTRTADRRVVLTVDKSRNAADDVRVELELYLCELDDGSSLVVGAPLSGPAEPDWRANLTINQLTLVDIMTGIFPGVGATKAELKSEARKRGRRDLLTSAELAPMGESAFRRAWDSLVTSGRFAKVINSQRFVINEVDNEVSE